MNSPEFHDRVVKSFKSTIASWDWDKNPLEWSGLPQQMLDLFLLMAKQSFESGPSFDCFGGPIHLRIGDFKDAKFTPHKEAMVKVEILPLEDCDDYVGGEFNLADAILKDAEGGDEGWQVAVAIKQLEGTIERLRKGAEKHGWDLEIDAF